MSIIDKSAVAAAILWVAMMTLLIFAPCSNADTDRTIRSIRYELNDSWQKPSDTLRTRRGDCNDIALLAVYLELKRGVPASELSMIEGYQNGVGHMIAKRGNYYFGDTTGFVPTMTWRGKYLEAIIGGMER